MKRPLQIPLRKPLIIKRRKIRVLALREPTAGDIEAVGNPVLINMRRRIPRISFDVGPMTRMIARCAGIPWLTAVSMSAMDWNTTAWTLAVFFMPDIPAPKKRMKRRGSVL